MDNLYNGVADYFYGGEIELTFYDKKSMEWWESLLNNIHVSYNDIENYTEIIVPKPPKYLFENV